MKNLSKWILGNIWKYLYLGLSRSKIGWWRFSEISEFSEISKWSKVKLNIGDVKEKEEKRNQQKNRNARFGDHERLDRPNPKAFKGKIIVNDSPEDINDIDRDFYA